MKEKRSFSIFDSHLDLAHSHWEKILNKGGWAIDATCGNGHDTLCLAQLVTPDSGVIGLDIQPLALENTAALLKKNSINNVQLYLQSHEIFPRISHPIRLIVYNLGYLPGGNKQLTTFVDTTLNSVKNGLELLSEEGVMSITCYSGHPEGEREENALIDFCKTLSPYKFNTCHHRWLNREKAPSLILIQKNGIKHDILYSRSSYRNIG